MSYVIGLDWAGESSWCYCQLPVDTQTRPGAGRLQAAEAPKSAVVANALKIVVDAPIGLPDCASTAQLRPCDRGARRWVGRDLCQSIQPVVSLTELAHWKSHPGKRRGGHLRGLLPAISFAAELRSASLMILESHPELVYAALAGRPLRRSCQKRTLQGILTRHALLREQGIDLSEIQPQGELLTADDLLDAGAMALVALDWVRKDGDLQVLRQQSGRPEALATASPSFLMALPGAATMPQPPPSIAGGGD